MSTPDDSPAAQAERLVERLFALLGGECRTGQRQLEAPRQHPEPTSAAAERELYITLLAALESGLVRTMDDALKILQHASQPLGPRGAVWLERQERVLDQGAGPLDRRGYTARSGDRPPHEHY